MSESGGQGPGESQAHWWRGRLWIVAAAALWSSSGLFAKSPWFDGWPVETRGLMLAFWRSLFSLLLVVPMVRRPAWHPGLVSMTVCFALMVSCFMSAMVLGTAANAIWLQYLSPVWVTLFGVWLLKERITVSDYRMLICCLSGVLMILAMEMRFGNSMLATFLGVLSGVAFAGVVLHLRMLRNMDPAWLMTLNQSAVALMLLPWVWSAPGQVSTSAYAVLTVFGVIQMGLPYILFAWGMRTVSSPEASVLSLLEPILTPVWVYIAWHTHPGYQAPQWWTWVGGALILFGLLLRYLPAMRETLRFRRVKPSR